jgi:hypothetical protein
VEAVPEKVCTKCGTAKPLTDFHRQSGARDGHRPECKACNLALQRTRREANPELNRARVRAWRDANPGRDRDRMARFVEAGKRPLSNRRSHLKRKYGMTLEQYDEMLELQGGGCAICGRQPREDISLHVDHCHETDVVRGILCFRCNNGIGDFANDPDLLRAAAVYLERGDALTPPASA